MTPRRFAAVILVSGLFACSQEQQKNDDALNKEVTQTLNREPAATTGAAQLTVTTKERIVRLDGIVENDQSRDRLEVSARQVKGVLGVDNRLGVRQPVQTTGASGSDVP